MSSPRYTSRIGPLESLPPRRAARGEPDAPDRRDGRVYDCTAEAQLAVEVALTSGRPLLLRGEPGSGKSTLAPFVARNLGWRFYEHVVTSSTRARDLLWRFDAVRRLSDAQARRREDPALDDARYVEPGALWWAFDRESAARLAAEPDEAMNATRDRGYAVVLIDELDKADPDVPNGLLVPLSSMTFHVEELGLDVTRRQRSAKKSATALSQVLVVITTNEERDLPPAFLRRCVTHTLALPGVDRLQRIARLHLAGASGRRRKGDAALRAALAKRLVALRDDALRDGRRPPSTAEYLDAVRACRALDISVDDSSAWTVLEQATLLKQHDPEAVEP